MSGASFARPLPLWVKAFLGLLLFVGGCTAWNETGIARAEARVHRAFPPGMTIEKAMSTARKRGLPLNINDQFDPSRGVWRRWGNGQIGGVRTFWYCCLPVGSADLGYWVEFGPDGLVRDVGTHVLTTFL